MSIQNWKAVRPLGALVALAWIAVIVSCGGGSQPQQQPPHVGKWTWVNGTNVFNQDGVYGTQGVATPSNVPGAREASVSWTDSQGNFWLFGGLYELPNAATGVRNDLWKFDGSNWTWMGGPDTPNQNGVYGTQGTPSPANVPGARTGAASCIDHGGN